MCSSRMSGAVFLALVLTISVFGRQNPSSGPQALALLQRSLAALTGGQSLNDVTLSGTVRRIAGSDDETGTATLKALASSGNRIDLNLPSGTRTEVRNISGSTLAGSWSGPDGASHPISYHNLLTDSGFFPAFTLLGFASSPTAVVAYTGTEVKNGMSVSHLTAYQHFPGLTGSAATLPEHLSQIDMFLDAATLLPVAITFNTHPDNNALLDLPVEIRFSDYRSVNGAQIPFHIQRFLNNSLLLDFQAQTATPNSGLPASLFNVQ